MRIITCNVNGIRSAVSKELWPWLRRQKADVVCLQEMRANEDQLPEPIKQSQGYNAHFFQASRPGYSGVAALSVEAPVKVRRGMGYEELDHEGRYLQLDFKKYSVVSLYIPSGSSGDERQQTKYRFLDHLHQTFRDLLKLKRPVIVCGDYNIAHKEIDLKNWKSNQKNSGFLPDERKWMDILFEDIGFVDAFRVVDSREQRYTWWSNRGNAYANNVGWRLDYQVVSPDLGEQVKKATIYTRKKFSDHAPLIVDYSL